MAKQAKKSIADSQKVKLGFVFFLTVVLLISGYLLFSKNNGSATLIEPSQAESAN